MKIQEINNKIKIYKKKIKTKKLKYKEIKKLVKV